MTDRTNPKELQGLVEEWVRLENTFHDSLPSQGEVGDPSHGEALCQFLYDNSDRLRDTLESLAAERDELRLDLERQMTIANSECNRAESLAAENERLAEAIQKIHRYALAAEGVGYDFILSVTDPLLEGES